MISFLAIALTSPPQPYNADTYKYNPLLPADTNRIARCIVINWYGGERREEKVDLHWLRAAQHGVGCLGRRVRLGAVCRSVQGG